MAELMLIGRVADVEIIHSPLDGGLTANCAGHRGVIRQMLGGGPDIPPCDWRETYDDLNDATEYASDHADGVR
jgi:hypothetical protein